MKSDLVILATAKSKPGKEADLERALRDVAAPTRAQPGCVAWTLHRVQGAPGTLLAYERWSSPEAHQAHLEGAHVQKLMAAMTPLLAEPPQIVAYEVLDG